MSRYDLNFRKLGLLLLPTFLRRPFTASFVYAVLMPLRYLGMQLRQLHDDTTYRITHTGQVCYLRAAVNDAFDPELRRITVDDDASVMETRIFMREEDRSIRLPMRTDGTHTINRRGFGGANGYDFWITVPLELRDNIDENKLRNVVNTYRLASKRWIINYK